MNNTKLATTKLRLQHWAQIFHDRANSGMNVKEYCAAQCLSKDAYYLLFCSCTCYNPDHTTVVMHHCCGSITSGTTVMLTFAPEDYWGSTEETRGGYGVV